MNNEAKQEEQIPASTGPVEPPVLEGSNVSSKEQGEMSLGKSSKLVSTSVLESEDENATTDQGGNPNSSTAPRLSDWAKVVQMSGRFAHVSIEQIERVRMMRDNILEGGRFSFNFNVLLLVASVLAALGLVSNNSTTIIASMLVSPIMGPVVAMAYGTTIFDKRMIRVGLVTESISLIFCVVIGVIIAAITGKTDLADDWPTEEMAIRGQWQNFYVALPVAFFSGLGVAVSLLDDQANSLVGVAISASLLPPAVNAGVVWIAYAYVDNHDGADRDEYREAGLISLLLTVANIVLIWFASVLMFRIKEVLPIKKKPFWDDLGVARKIYQNKAFMKDDYETNTETA